MSQRARGEPGARRREVVRARSDVVRRVGVEERRQVLNVAAAGAELELAAAVGRDALLLAVVVRVEESLQRPEPRRLDVDRTRLPGQRLDVLDRVDDRVPGDPLCVRLEDRPCLVGHGGILDQCIREALDEEPVQPRVGRLVDHRAFVLALEVEDVDAAELDQLGDELLRPAAPRVELERAALDSARASRAPAPCSADRRGPSRRRSSPARARDRPRRRAACPPAAEPGRARRTRRPSDGSRGRPPDPARAVKSSSPSSSAENESIVCDPDSSRPSGGGWSSAAYVTSSPTPSSPRPRRRTTVVTRVNSGETACSSRSSAYDSTSSGSSRSES